MSSKNKIEVPQSKNWKKTSNLNQNTTEWIDKYKTNSQEILKLSYHEKLYQYAVSKSEWLFEDWFDIEKFYENIYDFYWEYDLLTNYKWLTDLKDIKYDEFIIDILCRLDIEIVPLKRLIKEYESEIDKGSKKILLLQINKCIKILINKYNFSYCDWNEEINITVDMLYLLSWREHVTINIWNNSINAQIIEEIAYFLQKIKFEENFDKNIWKVNKKILNNETKQFWSKWANLNIIKNILKKINSTYYEFWDNFVIQDFERINVSTYDKWVNWENIIDDLEYFYKWIKSRKIMVRSSAVYSEDWENVTGAWIYESIEFNGTLSINDFKNVVIKIYESVNSARALKYRKENWIEKEQMWIVLQELVEVDKFDEKTKVTSFIRDKWYVNTIVKWVPKLMDIYVERWMRPVIDRNILYKNQITDYDIYESIFYYQIDKNKYYNLNLYNIEQIASLSFLLEKHYGEPIQIEYITSEIYPENAQCKIENSILQARLLPKNYKETKEITFPNKQILFEWRALWIWNINLNILPNNNNNSDKKWIVFFKSSKITSLWKWFQEKNLPKSWTVVVLWESNEYAWHIETLCAEKWILLIFNENYNNDIVATSIFSNANLVHIDKFQWQEKIHIVMDWLIWRIYRQSAEEKKFNIINKKEKIEIKWEEYDLTTKELIKKASQIVVKDIVDDNYYYKIIEYFAYLLSLHSCSKDILQLKENSKYILEKEIMPKWYDSVDIRDFDMRATPNEKVNFIIEINNDFKKNYISNNSSKLDVSVNYNWKYTKNN